MIGPPAVRRRDQGFTLIELLVVMIIIGILAGISVPMIINQRGKTRDTATRSDLHTLQLEIIGRLMENPAPPTVQIVGERYQIDGVDVGAVTPGTRIAGPDPTSVTTTGWTPAGWCLALTNDQGVLGTFKASASGLLEPGACTSPTQP